MHTWKQLKLYFSEQNVITRPGLITNYIIARPNKKIKIDNKRQL